MFEKANEEVENFDVDTPTEDTVNTDTDVVEDETTETSEEKPADGRTFFGKLFDKLTGKGEQKASEEVEADSAEEIEVEDDIYNAAKAAGWSDDKIAQQYKEDKSVLQSLVKKADVKSNEDTSQPAKKVDTTTDTKPTAPTLTKFDLKDEALKDLRGQYGDDIVDKVVLPLVTQLNQTIDMVNQQSAKHVEVDVALERQQLAQQVKTFQTELDKLGKKYEVFGQWENVPRDADGKIDAANPIVKTRQEVWGVARVLQKSGLDWDAALAGAIDMFKGRHMETITKSEIIKELANRKVKFSPRPTSKKTTPAKLTGDAAKISVIDKGLKSIGR